MPVFVGRRSSRENPWVASWPPSRRPVYCVHCAEVNRGVGRGLAFEEFATGRSLPHYKPISLRRGSRRQTANPVRYSSGHRWHVDSISSWSLVPLSP